MNKMKRILTVVLTLALLITMMPSNLTGVNAKTTTRLSSKKIVLQVGKTKKLKVKNKPAGVKVVWKSSKKKVATVSKKGKVKAKKPGKTTITAKVGKKKYKCKVIVKRKNSIKVTKPSDNNNSVINQVTTKSEPSQIVTTKAEVKTTKTETTKKNDSITVKPTVAPTLKPTVVPTTVAPTAKPTTVAPTAKPTTVAPTTVAPTAKPTVAPTLKPTAKPTTVAPTTANGNVDESIKAPEGLVHAPGEGLPYHFAWAAVDGADGYNVYIDGVYVTKVTENVADLDASMFTKGAVEYTVGVATVKENKTSAITSIKYTYDGSGQPATTKVSVTTTVAPVATTVAPVTTPSVPGQDVDESIKAPEGLVWAGNTDLPYYFAWAKADGIDSYNVYVDGTLVANVVDGSVNLNESVFTKGSGEYAIGIAAVKGNKTSVITSIKYTYAGSGQPVTTKAPEPSTAKPTDVTVAPTAPGQDIDESIQAPVGLVWAGNADLPYYFAWAPVVDVDSYNVYVDGVYATNVGASSVNLDKAVFTKGSGEYTIGVASVKN
ncbi:Ig-like domain-containing protein, partial [Eubacterium ventriosum]|uniref:Ig-like domain-containing protein n=1 Tax=Eubacterium ventriosum TaxID=39496 RepID=UPI00189CB4EB